MKLSDIMRSWRTAVVTGSTTLSRVFVQLFGGLELNASLAGQLSVLLYGPTIAVDFALGNDFVFSITDNVAFVLSNPTNAPPAGFDGILRVTYKNISGGAHGAGTFGTLYKVSGNFAAVATANQRTIGFRWDGTNWVEIWRTAADVAN